MTTVRTRIAVAALLAWPVLALAQPYKCQDANGKTTFTDLPCPGTQTSTQLDTRPASGPAPAAPRTTMSAEALEREKARAESAERRRQTQATIDSNTQRIRQIREENKDPARCQAARARMAQIEKHDRSYKTNLDYFEYQQKASLYCGN